MHLHYTDIDTVDKLHSLTNHGFGLKHCGLDSQVLGLDNQVLDNNTGFIDVFLTNNQQYQSFDSNSNPKYKSLLQDMLEK